MTMREIQQDITAQRLASARVRPWSGLRLPMSKWRAVRRKAAVAGFGALLGCVLVFGPGVTLRGPSTASLDSASAPDGIVLGFEYAVALAESRRLRRLRRKRAAQRKAAERHQQEADKKLLENRIETLPANCAFDSFASFSSPTEVHVCGAFYYLPYEEDGVSGFEGYPIGFGRDAFKKAKARRDKARNKRLAEARKQLNAGRKGSLSTDCAYDSFASFAVRTNVYTCGGIQFRQVQENGKTVFDRRGVITSKTKQELARRAQAQAKRRAKAGKGAQGERRTILPAGCAYDSYASFFTSSNVYDCDGFRYRQNLGAEAESFDKVGF